MSRFSLGVALLAVWLLLWGSVSAANVIGGVALITVLYLVFPSTRPLRPTHLARPLAVIRLLGFFVKDVVVSTAVVATEIMTPRSRLQATVLEVPMHTDRPSLLTLIAHLVALSPGTMAVKVVADPPVITMHVLARGDGGDGARAGLYDLERHCIDAFAPNDVREAYWQARAGS